MDEKKIYISQMIDIHWTKDKSIKISNKLKIIIEQPESLPALCFFDLHD